MRNAFRLLAIAAVVAVTAGFSTALSGPPWIAVEHPPSPYDRTTRDAFVLVHAFRHGQPVAYPVSGTAEGLVNGKRVTRTLQLSETSRTGVYALKKQWPDKGLWTLVLTVHQSEEARATAIVELDRRGEVASVEVPMVRRAGYELAIPRDVTPSEIDRALRERARRAE